MNESMRKRVRLTGRGWKLATKDGGGFVPFAGDEQLNVSPTVAAASTRVPTSWILGSDARRNR